MGFASENPRRCRNLLVGIDFRIVGLSIVTRAKALNAVCPLRRITTNV